MRAVLMSIRPKWCKLIASGKKTIEVRKTRPKLETPFKCYIYCTQSDLLTKSHYDGRVYSTLNKFREELEKCGNITLSGKVIGEFVCDGIKCITPDSFIVKEAAERALLGSCLTPKQAKEYAGWKHGAYLYECKDLYSWHISDLVIYGTPKALSEFLGLRETRFGYAPVKIIRAPQSWCYVEEVANK